MQIEVLFNILCLDRGTVGWGHTLLETNVKPCTMKVTCKLRVIVN